MSEDFWASVRAATPARIGIGRAGDGVPTAELLAFGAAHAEARDAIHAVLPVESLVADLGALGLGTPQVVRSAAPDRSTYLRRPDLGRTPDGELSTGTGCDLAIVIADGLSAHAVECHAVAVVTALLPLLSGLTVGPPVLAVQARVALGDHIGEALRASAVLVLIGERPGLSTSDSLGAYLTWRPRPGTADSARNCVSNIRTPDGLHPSAAARTIASLLAGARELGATGVRLKDTSNLLA